MKELVPLNNCHQQSLDTQLHIFQKEKPYYLVVRSIKYTGVTLETGKYIFLGDTFSFDMKIK